MSETQPEAKLLRHRLPGDDDSPLLDRALAGDSEAFEDLVRRHECRVFRTALALTGNPEDAEEVLQDTFLSVYQHLGGFDCMHLGHIPQHEDHSISRGQG